MFLNKHQSVRHCTFWVHRIVFLCAGVQLQIIIWNRTRTLNMPKHASQVYSKYKNVRGYTVKVSRFMGSEPQNHIQSPVRLPRHIQYFEAKTAYVASLASCEVCINNFTLYLKAIFSIIIYTTSKKYMKDIRTWC